jgi:hypothetical protein
MQPRPILMFICVFLTVRYHKGYRWTKVINSVDLGNSEGQQYPAAARCNFDHVAALPPMAVIRRCFRRVAEAQRTAVQHGRRRAADYGNITASE